MKFFETIIYCCNLYNLNTEAKNITFSKIPFIFTTDNTDYLDNSDLNIESFLKEIKNSSNICKTSCPPPGAWYEEFKKGDNILAITISSQLSGSYNSALTAQKMLLEHYPDKNICVIDSKGAGSKLDLMVTKITKLIQNNYSFDEVVCEAKKYSDNLYTLFTLSSFDNLIKNGRMSKFTGFLAGKLGIMGIGIGSKEGKINIIHKTRGMNKCLPLLIDTLKEKKFTGNEIIISHCFNQSMADKLSELIKLNWPNTTIKILPTSGLCSFYAEEGGLIIAF